MKTYDQLQAENALLRAQLGKKQSVTVPPLVAKLAYAQNHYEGPIRRTRSLDQLNRLLKDRDALDAYQWKILLAGGIHFHKHPKTGVEHQLWTDEAEGTVALQKLLGWW